VGSKKGNYVLTNAASISRIYEYITPINNFHKEIMLIIQLVAPTKIQVATFLGKYTPSENGC
jgi:hypothetical protein